MNSIEQNKAYKLQKKLEKEQQKYQEKLQNYRDRLMKQRIESVRKYQEKLKNKELKKISIYEKKESKKYENKIRVINGKKPLKKNMIKENQLPKLKKKLFTLIQKYVRLRDSNAQGIGKCISCGKTVNRQLADGGHYISRSHMSTAFDERNINLQCKYCNGQLHGNVAEYRKNLILKIGESQVLELEDLKNTTKNRTEEELETLIKNYEIKNEREFKKKLI